MKRIVVKTKEDFNKVMKDDNKIYMGCEITVNSSGRSCKIYYENKESK